MTAKIDSIEVVPTTLPDLFGEPLHLCFVRVEAEGVIGWGEVCDSYCCTFPDLYLPIVDAVYAPLLRDSGATAVDALARKLRMWARRRIGDAGLAMQALSGVELALWDLHGKVEGRPVSELVGQVRDRVPVYASGVFLDVPTSTHADILGPALDRGVRTAKVRSSLDPAADVIALRRLREELPTSLELMVDGNENFSVPTALRLAAAFEDLGVVAFEEPVPQVFRRAIARLVQKSPVPIAYGEHLFGAIEFDEALSAGWPDIVQPDPAIVGGFSECLRVAVLAEGHGVQVMPHSAAGPISLAASLHVAASQQNVRLVEHAFTLEPLWEAVTGSSQLSRAAIDDGELPVPSGPGFGVEIDEDVLRAHPYRPRSYDLSMPTRSVGLV